MPLLAALILALVAPPPSVRAQDVPWVGCPAAAEVAAGVLACLELDGDTFLLTADRDWALISAADDPLLDFVRTQPGARQFGPREHAIADDLFWPPVVMSTDAPTLSPEAIACYEREYRRLLVP